MIRIEYFSDILCVWAYTAQIRLDELQHQYAARVQVYHHFIPVFGCTQTRIGEGWKDRGGFDGFGDNVKNVCRQFPHVTVHPDVWTRNVPPTSAGCHHFLKSIELLQRKGVIDDAAQERLAGKTFLEAAAWDLRLAFFRDVQNVSERAVQLQIAERLGIPQEPLVRQLDNGEAMALLCEDLELKEKYQIEGSPTYVLNEGRQKLYGNVGYKVIAANVEELLNRPTDQASWC